MYPHDNSKWTHNICVPCWNSKNPDRLAVSINNSPDDICCYCGERNNDGIYVRDDPEVVHGEV